MHGTRFAADAAANVANPDVPAPDFTPPDRPPADPSPDSSRPDHLHAGPTAPGIRVLHLADRDATLTRATGSADARVHGWLVNDLSFALTAPPALAAATEDRVCAAVSAMCDIAPRDTLEGMLAAQMVAVHSAALDSLRRAAEASAADRARDADLRHAAEHEQPVTLEDLMFRRVGAGWTETMAREGARVAADSVADILGWDEARIDKEVNDYLAIIAHRHGVSG